MEGKERILESLREQGGFRIDQVTDCLARLLPLFVSRQVRYKVTDVPDRRTIRYYMSRGLLDKPAHHGRVALFNYRHVLQLLAIKALQSQYLPLRKTSEIVRAATDQDLEAILLASGKNAQSMARGLPPILGAPGWRRFKIDEQVELLVEDGFEISRVRRGIEGVSLEVGRILEGLAREGSGAGNALTPDPDAWRGDRDLRILNPAPPLPDLSSAVVALITEGGLVPLGNPDRLEGARSTRYLKYGLQGLDDLRQGEFESVDRGWDNTFVNQDPDRLLPLDVMREIEREKRISEIYECFYTTTGVATTVDGSRGLGRLIAADLRKQGISAAILTAT